jgi:hypothetical protein
MAPKPGMSLNQPTLQRRLSPPPVTARLSVSLAGHSPESPAGFRRASCTQEGEPGSGIVRRRCAGGGGASPQRSAPDGSASARASSPRARSGSSSSPAQVPGSADCTLCSHPRCGQACPPAPPVCRGTAQPISNSGQTASKAAANVLRFVCLRVPRTHADTQTRRHDRPYRHTLRKGAAAGTATDPDNFGLSVADASHLLWISRPVELVQTYSAAASSSQSVR